MKDRIDDDIDVIDDEARRIFHEELAQDLVVERRLPWKELGSFGAVLAVVLLHQLA